MCRRSGLSNSHKQVNREGRVVKVICRLQVDTTCFSCSPPNLDPYFIFMYMHYNHCHRATAHLQLNFLLLLSPSSSSPPSSVSPLCRVWYVTTWSVVLLNKKIHILLSQVYCV